MSKENWFEKSQAAITQIYNEEPNETNTLLLGALLAIIEHKDSDGTIMPEFYNKPTQAVNSLPMNKTLRELVEDELSDADMYAGMGEYEIAHDELRHADRFLNVLKAQPDKYSIYELVERRNAIATRL